MTLTLTDIAIGNDRQHLQNAFGAVKEVCPHSGLVVVELVQADGTLRNGVVNPEDVSSAIYAGMPISGKINTRTEPVYLAESGTDNVLGQLPIVLHDPNLPTQAL